LGEFQKVVVDKHVLKKMKHLERYSIRKYADKISEYNTKMEKLTRSK
jgi:hypothetical protein